MFFGPYSNRHSDVSVYPYCGRTDPDHNTRRATEQASLEDQVTLSFCWQTCTDDNGQYAVLVVAKVDSGLVVLKSDHRSLKSMEPQERIGQCR